LLKGFGKKVHPVLSTFMDKIQMELKLDMVF